MTWEQQGRGINSNVKILIVVSPKVKTTLASREIRKKILDFYSQFFGANMKRVFANGNAEVDWRRARLIRAYDPSIVIFLDQGRYILSFLSALRTIYDSKVLPKLIFHPQFDFNFDHHLMSGLTVLLRDCEFLGVCFSDQFASAIKEKYMFEKVAVLNLVDSLNIGNFDSETRSMQRARMHVRPRDLVITYIGDISEDSGLSWFLPVIEKTSARLKQPFRLQIFYEKSYFKPSSYFDQDSAHDKILGRLFGQIYERSPQMARQTELVRPLSVEDISRTLNISDLVVSLNLSANPYLEMRLNQALCFGNKVLRLSNQKTKYPKTGCVNLSFKPNGKEIEFSPKISLDEYREIREEIFDKKKRVARANLYADQRSILNADIDLKNEFSKILLWMGMELSSAESTNMLTCQADNI